MDRDRCIACGDCVGQCSSGALSNKGSVVSAGDIVAMARRMEAFFANSGGGITLSGGEVTMQDEFAVTVLAGCKQAGIHTAIETCGACEWSRLERIAQHTDVILYDIKLFDETAHRYWTGAGNRTILENARRLANRQVIIRVPLIPGITDTDDNLNGVFGFMAGSGLSRVSLLPYNPSAGAKYEWLGRSFDLQFEQQSPARLDGIVRMARRFGLDAWVD
jgi:pyruvate formate lyase activating enzyme